MKLPDAAAKHSPIGPNILTALDPPQAFLTNSSFFSAGAYSVSAHVQASFIAAQTALQTQDPLPPHQLALSLDAVIVSAWDIRNPDPQQWVKLGSSQTAFTEFGKSSLTAKRTHTKASDVLRKLDVAKEKICSSTQKHPCCYSIEGQTPPAGAKPHMPHGKDRWDCADILMEEAEKKA